jgi:hypothetical protein
MIGHVMSILRWPVEDSLAESIQISMAERLAGVFGRALVRVRASAPERVSAITELINAADPSKLVEFLLEPATFPLLVAEKAGATALLEAAERYFSASLAATNDAFTDWIAFEGPQAFGADIPIKHITLFPPALELKERARLLEADALLRTINVAAWRVTHRFTQLVVIRRDDSRWNRFISSSSPRYPGRTVLINTPVAPLGELADALLHESIHGVLNAEQLRCPFVYDHSRIANRWVTSPWTGNVIPADALLEACFVWFGLWHFWRAASDAADPDRTRLLARAEEGFFRANLGDLFTSDVGILADDVVPTVRAMQAEVLAVTDTSVPRVSLS